MTDSGRRRGRLAVLVVVAAVALELVLRAGGTPAPGQQSPSYALRESVTRFSAELPAAVRDDVTTLYAAFGWSPMWGDTRRPSPLAERAISLLRSRDDEGLGADDVASPLTRTLAALRGGSASAGNVADFDVQLTVAVLHHLRALHFGRVDPLALGVHLAPRTESHDVATVLAEAIVARDPELARTRLAPRFAQYSLLRAALSRYRLLATTTDAARPPALPDGVLRGGEWLPGRGGLHRFLIALGDMSEASDGLAEAGPYDATTAAAVAHFQRRHGLDADGVVGNATRRALAVPITWRVRQIEMAMERLRWVSDLPEGPLIAVNIPMFRLWAWDHVPTTSAPALDMAVVVGRALNHRTPIFVDTMERVVLRPYWNVPRSIVRAEILPALARNPRYLDEHAFEIVDQTGAGDRLGATAEAIARLASGRAHLRQRPGPSNALGLIKFLFPNPDDVYMHATPETELFSRARRDFSHGCIRVEDPVALAAWVLRERPEWSPESIQRGMAGAATETIELPSPIPVVIFYTTAVVTPDGILNFPEDVYGQDPLLSAAL